jgi:hypothetical protein
MESDTRQKINEIMKMIDNLRKEGLTDAFDIEMKILNEHPETYDRFPFIIKKLCREINPDLAFLYKMLDMLDDVNNGNKTLASVEYTLGEELANKFVYPVVNNLTNEDIDLSKYKNVKID